MTIERNLAVVVLAILCAAGARADDAAGPKVRRFRDVTAKVGLRIGRTQPPTAWTDFDRDGWVDVYVCGALWRNVEGRRFEQVEGAAMGGGVLWGDYDNDGWRDAFDYSRFRIFRNRKGKGFRKRPILSRPGTCSIGAAWGDFDNDGWLDIYSAGYEQAPQKGKPQRFTPDEYTPDVIFMNREGKRFEEVWRTPESERRRPARGVAPADFDEDGDLDLYVSNYRLEPNHLLLNRGDGTFVNVAAERGVEGDGEKNVDRGHTIGSAWADLDNDGHLDLFVGNFSHPAKYQDRPRFYRNLGSKKGYRFRGRSRKAGLKWIESFACPAFGDFDNDGDLDLYYSTFYPGDKSVLYRNDGDWTFTNVTRAAGIDTQRTYGAAWADYDNDGWLDILSGGKLYRNPGGKNHWLKVRLEGDGRTVNRDAIGAQVRIRLGGRVLTRQVEGAVGQANQSDPTLHFGLGAHAGEVELEIRWPDGTRESRKAMPDKTVAIVKRPPAPKGD